MTGDDLGTARGNKTRDALLGAAVDVFGRNGFAAASTRAIAEVAGVNPALIAYHFGGKSGLYRAALQHIASAVEERMGPLATAIEAELGARDAPRQRAEAVDGRRSDPVEHHLQALHRLTDAFVAMLTSDDSAAWARLILREQQDPTESFDVLYAGIMRRLIGVTARLIGRIQNRSSDAPETRLTAITVLGQALVFRTARAAVMRQMSWRSLGPEEVAVIQRALRRNVTAILTQEIRA